MCQRNPRAAQRRQPAAAPARPGMGRAQPESGRATCYLTAPFLYTNAAMKIRVINPNTTAGMTASIGAAARAVSASGTEITAVHPSFGAPSIECHHDDVWAAAGVAEQVRHGEA